MKTIMLMHIIICVLAVMLIAQTNDPAEDARIFARGYSYFLESNYKEALNTFDEFQRQFPQSALLDRALFWKAWCNAELEKYSIALSTYDELVKKFPQSTYTDDALFKMGEIYENNLHDYDRALKTYERLISLYPDLNQAPGQNINVSSNVINAQQQRAQISEERYRDMPQALDEWEKSQQLNKQAESFGNKPGIYFNMKAQERINFIKNNSDHDYVPLNKFIEAEVLCREDKYEQAIIKYQELLRQFPDSTLADNAAYGIVVCLRKQNKTEEEKAALKKFHNDYPDSEIKEKGQ